MKRFFERFIAPVTSLKQYIPGNEQKMLFFIAGMLLVMFFMACANVVAPTGGPRDEDPPVVIRSVPPNFSPNYGGEQIRISFDEFIVLNNLRQQLLVSPPLENSPEIRVRGRNLIIDIEDELRPNTTYSIFMGDAVRDNTEGNAIPNFRFVFSTGDYVDSLSLSGKVINAFTLKPEEAVFVMLYDSIYDSIPYKERPVYLSKTNKEGLFEITNMKEGSYMMFALFDNNGNFIYDLPDEKIAFLDSLVTPRYIPSVVEPDTLMLEDSLDVSGRNFNGEWQEGDKAEVEEGGTTGAANNVDVGGLEAGRSARNEDDLEVAEVAAQNIQQEQEDVPFFTLYLFQERDTVQRITSRNLVRKGQIQLTFRVPYDSICFRDIRGALRDDWYIPEFGVNRDTINVWFEGVEQDSLFLEVYDGIHLLDTVKLATTPRVVRGRDADSESQEPAIPPVSLVFGRQQGGSYPYYKPFTAKASSPIMHIDQEKITAILSDTISLDVTFNFIDYVQRNIVMSPALEESEYYRLKLLPGALTDIFGATNDTLEQSFKTSNNEDYGKLIINIDIRQEVSGDQNGSRNDDDITHAMNYILQLLDKDGKSLQEKYIKGSGMYGFPYLSPGNYSFRLIEDRNNNKKWDTGHYLKGILPERVFMYEETIQVRQNWETEENWIVGN
jgi:uncharacterized protein (DUF2141 family)